MPILEQEPEVFPDRLFDEPADDAPWWVAYVRSRQEKRLARYLRTTRVPHYLPQYEKRTRLHGKTRVSHLPLFTGYLFFRGGPPERRRAIQSNLTVTVLDVLDQRRLHAELESLWTLQDAGAPFVPHPYIGPGDAVEIVDGPFTGYRGIVEREKGKLRLVVSISLLRRSVATEVDRAALAPDRYAHHELRKAG